MTNNTIQIERYLQHEMDAAERAVFENELSTNAALKEELNIQQQMITAINDAGLKMEFAKAISKQILIRRIALWTTVIIVCIAAIVWFTFKNNRGEGEGEGAHGRRDSTATKFMIDNTKDTIIETKDGVVFGIPAHAFNSSSNTVELEIKTALNAADIIKNGLSTVSNGALLQTAGMFYLNGFVNDEPVSLAKDIAVSVPAATIDPNMQLFDGVQDSAGPVNWVNPKPVSKSLRTYDITTLDFYPPLYIPTVKALKKDYLNKVYTDSLYYSFSGYNQRMRELNYRQEKPVTDSIIIKDTAAYAAFLRIMESSKMDSDTSYENYVYQIDPAIIRSIWDKKFNNTFIATKEFEERLRYMHSVCAEGFINIYLKHLNEPLYVADELCAKTYPYRKEENKFFEFAARKDGGVMLPTGIQQKLSNYFQEKYTAYKKAAELTWAKYQKTLDSLDDIADSRTREQGLNDFRRTNTNFKKELCANITDAYKQIGHQHDCGDSILPPPANYYNVTISTTGWKNLDAYVFDATQNRQSMSYTDPATGKTARLTYAPVTITIENIAQFDKVQVYLIPDSLSSFQRVEQQDGNFKESLNALFKYDAIAVGYKGTQVYFLRQPVQPKEYTFTLQPATNEGLLKTLSSYSAEKNTALVSEFNYRLFEQQEAMRYLQLAKDRAFREKIASSIYACGEGSMYGDAYRENISYKK
jgi:hypothetical protein